MVHSTKKSITIQNYQESENLCRQNAQIKLSNQQTQYFVASSLKTSKTGGGTKQF